MCSSLGVLTHLSPSPSVLASSTTLPLRTQKSFPPSDRVSSGVPGPGSWNGVSRVREGCVGKDPRHSDTLHCLRVEDGDGRSQALLFRCVGP